MICDSVEDSGLLPEVPTDFDSVFDAKTAKALARIACFASKSSIQAFLVGGAVRDLLIGRLPVSTTPDLTVVGEACSFAQQLAEGIESCSLVSMSQHHTAAITIGNTAVEIASARTDLYDPPGSLPRITLVDNMVADLSRRDFTTNAMAMPLLSTGMGQLIDPFDGWKDVRERKLRVIRGHSFVEDPLRIMRGVRIAARYQFSFEPKTKALISASLPHLEMMTLRSPQRVFNEFRLWFDAKENLAELVSIADETGLLVALGILSVDAISNLSKVRPNATELERFAAFAYRLDQKTIDSLVERLHMPAEWRSTARHVTIVREIAEECTCHQVTDIWLRNSLIDIREEVVQAVIATETNTSISDRFREFHSRLRHIRSELDGDDVIGLGAPQGPLIGQLLNELLERRIDGSISTVREERSHIIRRLSGD